MTDGAELILRFSEKWKSAEKKSDCRILRLAILRDLHRILHANRSKHLALGKQSAVKNIQNLEDKITQLRETDLNFESLDILLSDKPISARRVSPFTGESLFKLIPSKKLTRPDRAWEYEIAKEASLQNWNFWNFFSWIHINEAENFHQQFNAQLWPLGVVLFVEGSDIEEHNGLLWRGQWTLTTNSSFKVEPRWIESLPGFSSSPTTPKWVKLEL